MSLLGTFLTHTTRILGTGEAGKKQKDLYYDKRSGMNNFFLYELINKGKSWKN